jgi:hypothetical protein
MSTGILRWSKPGAKLPKHAAPAWRQVAIAWVAPQGREIVPLVGARPPRSAGGALDLILSADNLAAIERAVPKGARPAFVIPPRRWSISMAVKCAIGSLVHRPIEAVAADPG